MLQHKVSQGECISSIAKKYGFKWETIWNLAENAQLKRERENPNVLRPNDIVHVPEKTKKEESCATEQKHRFRLLGVPAYLNIRITEEPPPEGYDESAVEEEPGAKDLNMEDPQPEQEQQQDEPRADTPYILKIDGFVVKESMTDSDGRIKTPIPPDAKEGELIIAPGTNEETTIKLNLGGLDPVDRAKGAKQRLMNLGFECGELDDEETPEFEFALREFQQKHNLDINGRLDQQTKDALVEQHGS